MKPLLTSLISAGLLCCSLAAGAAGTGAETKLPQVLIKTSAGEIVLELYPEAAPKTVENFLQYVKAGQYKGTIFHRVINNFMIQGGGFDKSMKEKPTRKPVPSEACHALQKGLKNELGTIAMARTEDPDSATAQFYINVKDNDFLNCQPLPDGDPVEFNYRGAQMMQARSKAIRMTAGYTPFGKVVRGLEVVDKIKAVETGNLGFMQDVPKKNIMIESVTLLK